MRINSFRSFSFLYFPFLWIVLATTAAYSLLNYFWLQHVSFLSENMTNMVFPGVLVTLAYIIFYKEKLHATPLKSDISRAYVIVLACALIAPIIFQHVISDLSIRQHAKVRYEEIKVEDGIHQYILEPPLTVPFGKVGRLPHYYTSYRKNSADDSHYEVFFVTLVKNNGQPLFWFGKKYSHVVNRDRSSNDEREVVYNQTIEKSTEDFALFIENNTVPVLEWNRMLDDYKFFVEAIQEAKGDPLLPVLTEPESRKPMESTLRAAWIVFAVGQVIWALVCIFIRVDEDMVDDHKKLNVVEKLKQRFIELLRTFSWFIPRKGYWVTPLLMDINIGIYLVLGMLGVSMMSPSGSELIPYGTNFTPLVLQGEIWRLMTAGFIHFGFFHLVMNMVALGASGYLLENVLGAKRFLSLYLISVLGCSLASLYWNHPANAAGASGGVFGLMGAMLLYTLLGVGDKANRVMFGLIFGMFGAFTLITDLFAWSHSDMAGHIGGLITGMVVGVFFISIVKDSETVEMEDI